MWNEAGSGIATGSRAVVRTIVWLLGFVVLMSSCYRVQQIDDDDSDGQDTEVDTEAHSDADMDRATDNDTDTLAPVECEGSIRYLELQPVQILILLDRSPSMVHYEMEGRQYGEIVEDAILAMVLQSTLSGDVNFALNVFPSLENCTDAYRIDRDWGSTDFRILCEAASRYHWPGAPIDETTRPEPDDYLPPLVPFRDTVSMDTYTDIQNALQTMGYCGGTPICQSLWWAAAYLQRLNTDHRKQILLVTDGAPNCNSNSNPSSCRTSLLGGTMPFFGEQCLDDTCSIQAARHLAALGYLLDVVSIGEEALAFEDVLDAIAHWGRSDGSTCESDTVIEPYGVCPAPSGRDNWFFPVANTAELHAAFDEITNAAMSCEFDVPWGEVPDLDFADPTEPVVRACHLVQVNAVVLNGVSSAEPVHLMYDAGCREPARLAWRWAGDALSNASIAEVSQEQSVDNCRRIQLCPAACEKVHPRNGEREWQGVSVSFGCPNVISP